jgi:hypothetical protein
MRPEVSGMAEEQEQEIAAAHAAAAARQVLADRIGELTRRVGNEGDALMVLRLAEAYADLAAEPPRARV